MRQPKPPKGVSNTQVSGGVLPWVLGIGIVVATLCVMLLLQMGYQGRLTVRYGWQRQVHRLAHSGLAWMLADVENYPHFTPVPITLPNDPPDTVWVERSCWGMWEFGKSYAKKGPHEAGTAMLLGHRPSRDGQLALYVREQGRPLAVAGDNTIRGDVKVTANGFRSAFINRIGYRKAQYVEGQTQTSETKLPTLDTEVPERFFQQLNQWTAVPPFTRDSLLQVDTVRWPFSSVEPLMLSVEGTLYLDGYWEGYIVLRASGGIVVSSSAQLSHVILEAPYITFKSGAQAQAQLWVKDSARLESGSRLNFPSALVMRDPPARAQVTLEAGSAMGGVLWGWFQNQPQTRRVASMDPGAKLVGQVYWPDGFEPQEATVVGQVVCEYLYLSIGGNQWTNHMFGATLDARARPESYFSPPLWHYVPGAEPVMELP